MLHIPESYNYIACFLTFACNFRCAYCINHDSDLMIKRAQLTAEQWVDFFQKLQLTGHKGLPITLGGGEPSLHKGFFDILKNTDERVPIDILTNLQFDLQRLVDEVDPKRLDRKAPYANIRVSYHPSQCSFQNLMKKIVFLGEHGFRVGVWAVVTPDDEAHILDCQKKAIDQGVDFRLKELLGWMDGQLYGSFKHPEGLERSKLQQVECKTSELLIGPEGNVYRCHYDLYSMQKPLGNVTDNGFKIVDEYSSCEYFGMCNPCDLKIKFNRFQEMGHCSVDIIRK